MNILLLSDLHLEFALFEVPSARADVVVLAGDVAQGLRGVVWAADAFAGCPVVYVAGNHEYYGHAIPRLTDELREEAGARSVYFLERASVTIGGVRFLGCTLWSDFGITGDQARSSAVCQEQLNDFRRIRVSPTLRRFSPADARGLHSGSVAWLREELECTDVPTVVVTHHAPCAASLNPAFCGDPINGAFASALDDLILQAGPAMWVHGHTHYCADYQVGGTRIVTNQRGYPWESTGGFEPARIVEITGA